MSAISTLLVQNKPLDDDIVVWGGDDAFTHTIVTGPTRCGKTSTVLHPMAYEIMKAKKKGKKVGFTIIEPKGDLVRDIYDMAVELGLEDEVVYIDPTNPNSHRLNVMQGDENAVIEATVAVLQSLFGKQEAFFSSVQNLSTRKVTALLKRLYKDNLDLITVLENLRDPATLQASVNAYRSQIPGGFDDLTNFFDNELLGTGKTAEQYRQLVIGLRSQLENITSNPHLRNIITGQSDINLDEHLEKGTILLVNTAAGLMGRSGDAFGMFVSMHIQLATFRRKGTEFDRIPHYLMIDEYSQYINPYVARFLSFAASYRVALIAAIQSFSQLEVASGDQDAKTIRNAIINTARNKIVFGGVEVEDAKYASEMMGLEEIETRSRTYDGGILKDFLPKSYKDEVKERPKFSQRFFMDGMPRFHCVCKLVQDGVATPSFLAKGEWIPRTWRELATKEDEILAMSDEDKLVELQKNRPPFHKWRERALYDVEIHEIKDRQKKRALLGDNPFNILTEATPEEPLNIQSKVIKPVDINLVNVEQKSTSIPPYVDSNPQKSKSNGLFSTMGFSTLQIQKDEVESKKVETPVQSNNEDLILQKQQQESDSVEEDPFFHF